MLQDVTGCYKMFQDVSRCCKVLHGVAMCYRLERGSIDVTLPHNYGTLRVHISKQLSNVL